VGALTGAFNIPTRANSSARSHPGIYGAPISESLSTQRLFFSSFLAEKTAGGCRSANPLNTKLFKDISTECWRDLGEICFGLALSLHGGYRARILTVLRSSSTSSVARFSIGVNYRRA
jgi:hypothetical protein